ncbi:hypothetical protein [Intestinimonas massiliensis (ex Afouda et al. 2020)]|uniref:hypothetical protein n=1 Tax=Intestinimonas massiliensis (ex Afouda et al. 2020) TaxID=1673721 RepID=UPI001F5F5481|nr:hypothetical protein [Intestinimonas massiliensis (ex Afouda et al. 2020)]
MKKKWIPLLALFLLLAGCTGSCGTGDVTGTAQPGQSPTPPASEEPTPSVRPVETERVSPSADPDPEISPTSSPTPEPAVSDTPAPVAEGPTDEEVLEAYRQAQEAFSWFQVSPMPFDPEDSREVDGVVYYRVDYTGISSLSALRGYLKSLFSDALVDTLLPYDGTQYIDINNVLYVQDGGRGTDIYRGAEYTQVMRADNPNRLVVQVTVEVVDPDQNGAVTGSETYEFPYEKVGDRWIFTDFSLVR